MSSNYKSRSSKKPVARKKETPPAEPKEAPRKLDSYQRDFRHPSGREWNRKKANVIAYYNGVCFLCNHPGVSPNGQVDHLVPFAETQDNSLANLRPVHGSSGGQKNPCPVCGLSCNQVRGGIASVEAARQKIQRRIAAQGLTPPVKDQDQSREWLYCVYARELYAAQDGNLPRAPAA